MSDQRRDRVTGRLPVRGATDRMVQPGSNLLQCDQCQRSKRSPLIHAECACGGSMTKRNQGRGPVTK